MCFRTVAQPPGPRFQASFLIAGFALFFAFAARSARPRMLPVLGAISQASECTRQRATRHKIAEDYILSVDSSSGKNARPLATMTTAFASICSRGCPSYQCLRSHRPKNIESWIPPCGDDHRILQTCFFDFLYLFFMKMVKWSTPLNKNMQSLTPLLPERAHASHSRRQLCLTSRTLACTS